MPRSLLSVGCAFLFAMVLVGCSREYSAGSITVIEPWSRATPAGVAVGAAYMVVRNNGNTAVSLVGGTTPIAETVEVHTMSMEGDVMRMRPATDGLQIPAGGSLELKPGGNHLMLIGLKKRLAEGEEIPLTLTFEPAASVEVEVVVESQGGAYGH